MLNVAIAAAFLAPAQPTTDKPCAIDLVGTWQLVSILRKGPGEKRDDAPFGKHPSGILVYTADGHTSVIISYDNRKRLSSDDRLAASIEEKATAFDTSFGYAGRYACMDTRITHHATVASFPNWVGTDMIRILKLADGKLILSTPPLLVGGSASTWELTWERPK
jgi:hypothetical protein